MFVFLADQQALTWITQRVRLSKESIGNVARRLLWTLDPTKPTFLIQSQTPELAWVDYVLSQLHWQCLERNPNAKTQIAQKVWEFQQAFKPSNFRQLISRPQSKLCSSVGTFKFLNDWVKWHSKLHGIIIKFPIIVIFWPVFFNSKNDETPSRSRRKCKKIL